MRSARSPPHLERCSHPNPTPPHLSCASCAASQKYLRSKFENLVTSVEVGLERVPGPTGAMQLAEKLARRSPTNNSRRYLAQLFSLLGEGQPTLTLTLAPSPNPDSSPSLALALARARAHAHALSRTLTLT